MAVVPLELIENQFYIYFCAEHKNIMLNVWLDMFQTLMEHNMCSLISTTAHTVRSVQI